MWRRMIRMITSSFPRQNSPKILHHYGSGLVRSSIVWNGPSVFLIFHRATKVGHELGMLVTVSLIPPILCLLDEALLYSL